MQYLWTCDRTFYWIKNRIRLFILVFLFSTVVTHVQLVSSVNVNNDDQSEDKLEHVRLIPSSSYYYSQSTASWPFALRMREPECIPKAIFAGANRRSPRASISRAFWSPERSHTDNTHYFARPVSPFVPRMGKRQGVADSVSDIFDNSASDEKINDGNAGVKIWPSKMSQFEYRAPDIDTFLLLLAGRLPTKKIDIIYEDSSKVCLSKAISNKLIQQIFEIFDTYRHRIYEKEEAESRHALVNHPIIYRARTG